MTHHPAGRRTRRDLVGGPRARGFTLVELLIAMALTLILVYAVAQFYAYVGETVRDGRAQIEMGGNLRQAASRLQQDFAELTVRVGGRIDPGSAQGVLEIWEGQGSDSDVDGDLGDRNNDGVFDDIVNFTPNDLLNANNTPLDVNGDGKPDSAMLGDCDDILVMTIRSQGDPFVGRWWNQALGNYQIVQSNLAEVTWFTTFKDANGDFIWQITEPRFLVRRQLLIRPDLAVSTPPPLTQGASFFHHNDISAHIVGPASGTPSWVANSLADLSQRENRFAHIHVTQPGGGLPNNGLLVGEQYMPNTMALNVGIPMGQTSNWWAYSLDGIGQFRGEDQMLSNLLAFDVRVYDPYAVLRADNSDAFGATGTTDDDAHGVLSPGDPGYAAAVLRNPQHPIMGYGAYVDLWYNHAYRYFPQPQRNSMLVACNSAYSWAPHARNSPGGAVWETWTTAYEKDGIQQVPPGYTPRVAAGGIPPEDWLVNGIDDDGINGVDDPGEAETAPPYPVYVGDNGQDDNYDGTPDDVNERNTMVYPRPIPTMLRGIEVRIRIYEPGTRQTRQVTVATDFIPE